VSPELHVVSTGLEFMGSAAFHAMCGTPRWRECYCVSRHRNSHTFPELPPTCHISQSFRNNTNSAQHNNNAIPLNAMGTAADCLTLCESWHKMPHSPRLPVTSA